MSAPDGPIRILGVPMDLGQNRRGVDMGPSAIRYAGLQQRLQRLGHTVFDGGNVNVPIAEAIASANSSERATNLKEIGMVSRDLHQAVRNGLAAGEHVICLGGDHSIALGSVSAALQQEASVAVLWIDAHADFNTPDTTPSGNVHGMVVSTLVGSQPRVDGLGDRLLKPEQIVMIGLRDIDSEERIALGRSGIDVYTMRDIDRLSMSTVMERVLHRFEKIDRFHVSLDMDSLDPHVVGGVGTPVPGGLTYREAHFCMESLAETGRVGSMDIVEVNPILDAQNHTAEVACALAASLFGKTIL